MARVDVATFDPNVRGCCRIDVTNSSAATKVQQTDGLLNLNVIIYNAGTVPVFVEDGTSAATAVAPIVGTPGSHCIAPGTTQTLRFAGQYCAAITASGTATIFVTPGEGS